MPIRASFALRRVHQAKSGPVVMQSPDRRSVKPSGPRCFCRSPPGDLSPYATKGYALLNAGRPRTSATPFWMEDHVRISLASSRSPAAPAGVTALATTKRVDGHPFPQAIRSYRQRVCWLLAAVGMSKSRRPDSFRQRRWSRTMRSASWLSHAVQSTPCAAAGRGATLREDRSPAHRGRRWLA